jgi:hypothetical protein
VVCSSKHCTKTGKLRIRQPSTPSKPPHSWIKTFPGPTSLEPGFSLQALLRKSHSSGKIFRGDGCLLRGLHAISAGRPQILTMAQTKRECGSPPRSFAFKRCPKPASRIADLHPACSTTIKTTRGRILASPRPPPPLPVRLASCHYSTPLQDSLQHPLYIF